MMVISVKICRASSNVASRSWSGKHIVICVTMLLIRSVTFNYMLLVTGFAIIVPQFAVRASERRALGFVLVSGAHREPTVRDLQDYSLRLTAAGTGRFAGDGAECPAHQRQFIQNCGANDLRSGTSMMTRVSSLVLLLSRMVRALTLPPCKSSRMSVST